MRRTENSDLQRELADAKSNADFWKGSWEKEVNNVVQWASRAGRLQEELNKLKFSGGYTAFGDSTGVALNANTNMVTVSNETWKRLNTDLREARGRADGAQTVANVLHIQLQDTVKKLDHERTVHRQVLENNAGLVKENSHLAEQNHELKRQSTAAKTAQSDDAYQDVYNEPWKGMAAEMNEQPSVDDSRLREIALNAAIASGGNELLAARFLKFLKG